MGRINIVYNPAARTSTSLWFVGFSSNGTNTATGTWGRATGLSGFSRTTGIQANVTHAGYVAMAGALTGTNPGTITAGYCECSCNISGGRAMTLYMVFYDASFNFLSSVSTAVTANTTVKQVKIGGTVAPASTAWVGLSLETAVAAASDVFTVTACLMERVGSAGTNTGAYADGDSDGWAWTSGFPGDGQSCEFRLWRPPRRLTPMIARTR